MFGTADLSNEVQQIIIQLQQSQGSHLSRGDVELLVHEIVGREVSVGLASVKEQHDQDSMHQVTRHDRSVNRSGIFCVHYFPSVLDIYVLLNVSI